jgi:hypothetical protein
VFEAKEVRHGRLSVWDMAQKTRSLPISARLSSPWTSISNCLTLPGGVPFSRGVPLATMFEYTPEIRRLIFTTNLIEGYNRQLRKVTKNRAAFPSPEAVRKLLWLAHRDIAKKWTMPIPNWPIILNQLAIRFEDRFPI